MGSEDEGDEERRMKKSDEDEGGGKMLEKVRWAMSYASPCGRGKGKDNG